MNKFVKVLIIALVLVAKLTVSNAQPNRGICPIWKIESVTDIGGGQEVVLYECAACCGSSQVYYIAEVRQIANLQGNLIQDDAPVLYASNSDYLALDSEALINAKMKKSKQVVFRQIPTEEELANVADADCEVDPKAFYKSDPDQSFWDWLWNGTRYVDGYGNTTYDVATAAAGGLC